MLRYWLMVAILMVAALGLCALSPANRAAWGAGDNAAQDAGAEGGEDLEAWLMDLFRSGLTGLHKVEASLSVGPIGSEWEKVLGVSPAEVDKELKSRVGAIPGLDADGDWLSGDPWLFLEIEPLVERSEDGEPTRVFVSVVLRLDEWVLVARSGEGEDPTSVSVMGTTWQGHRLVSGAPVEVGKQVEAAADELLDSFERSYRSSNEPSEKTGGE